jgi:hypothetical protein
MDHELEKLFDFCLEFVTLRRLIHDNVPIRLRLTKRRHEPRGGRQRGLT